MTLDRRAVFALVAVVLVAVSGVATAATYALNTSAAEHPDTYHQADYVEIASHDRATMAVLEYEDDNGNLERIAGFVNGTAADETVSYWPDQVEEAEFGEYPRKSDETNNSASALDAGEYTTGGANASKLAVTQTDGATAAGVTSIKIGTDGSMASGDTAYASYANQSISSDVSKRVAQYVLNVGDLGTNTVVEIQVRDGGGDYVAAEINASANADDADVIANGTGDGIVYQQKLGELAVQGSGDGTLDAIEELRVVTTDGDVNVTFVAVNLEKKTKWDFGTARVTNSDGDYQDETVYEHAGGRLKVTSLSTLGSWADDAVVHHLRYHDVQLRMQDDPSAVEIEFTEGKNYPGFPAQLRVTYRQTLPTGYDVSYGDVDLLHHQPFLSDRYVTFRYAEAVGDTATADLSSSDWTDLSGKLGDEGTDVTADSTVTPGTTNVLEFRINLLEDEETALQAQQGGAGGFWGGQGGGNPLLSIWNWIAGGIVGLLTTVAVKVRSMGS